VFSYNSNKPRKGGLQAILCLGVGISALTAFSAPAMAQETTQDVVEDEARTLQTVTVTAGKREQTLQDVPIAVSVVDDAVIEAAAITDILDLQSVVPSLRVGQFQQSGNATFSIRGFGNGANNTGTEPSVSVFIDGVYRTRAAGGLSDYSDISRIEVLRGPQSTLFGKNASVGVINVVTDAPQFEFGGKVEGTLGNYNQQIIKGSVTGPLSETVAFSLGGSYNKRDGYAKNTVDGTDLNDRDRYSIKGQLLLEPTQDLSIRLIADYDKLDEVCCYTPNIVNGPTSAAITAAGGTVISDPFGFRTALDKNPTNEISNSGISAQVDYDLGDITLTSITALRNQDLLSDGDVDFTSLRAISSNVLDYNIDTFTQELRLVGSTEKFDYVLGAFYFDEEIDQKSDVIYDSAFYDYGNLLSGGGIAAVEALLGFAPRSFYEPGTGSREAFTQENTSYSLFAQGDYQLTDRLTATLGISYINDEKTVTGTAVNDDLFSSLDLATGLNNPTAIGALAGVPLSSIVAAQAFQAVTGTAFTPAGLAALQTAAGGGDTTAIATLNAIGATAGNPAFVSGVSAATAAAIAGQFEPLQFLPGFVNFPNSVEGNKTSDSDVTYTVRLAYDLNDSINLYGSYATGFKASSWNLTRDSSFDIGLTAAMQTAGLVPQNRGPGTRLAGPEETEVFEIGAKLSLPNLALNVAVFDQTITGFQSTIFQGTGFVLANAGEQSTQGIEWDATWSPTAPLTLTFAGILQDPIYDDFKTAPGPNGTVVDLSGEQPAGISEVSLYLASQYDHEFANGMTGYVRADYVYESEVEIADNVPGISREVGTVNGSLGLTLNNGLELQLWGRNLFNDEYYQAIFPTVAQAGSVNGYPNAPRTFGITARKSF
jgi:iron complex outermembrane recepter protein